MNKEKRYRLVIFDMDGTILNSLEDITDSINEILNRNSMPSHTIKEVQYFVGNGLHKLVERAVVPGSDEALIEKIYAEFVSYYKDHCHIKTRPYDGIIDLIKSLREEGYLTAVSTNKAENALNELLKIHFDGMFDCAIGARDGMPIKPSKEMAEYILRTLQVNKEDAVYVGDSDVDIMTAVNSGLDYIGVTWGFRERDFLMEHGAKTIIDKPYELLELV